MSTGAKKSDAENTMLRINASRVATLMDLVGELSLASDEVIHHPALNDLDNFQTSKNKLNQLIRELQDIVSNLRLIPIEGVFRKMQRLARDLAKQTGKDFKFNLAGEETEIDKVVVDTLSDPLVHIIRNSIDHGLEMPEERALTKKPAQGRVSLTARQEGGEIMIIIEDDGAGLNRERILERARSKGLIDPKDILPDSKVWELIFEPGFSTKEAVSQLSGRGVGMDVVKTTIAYLRGRIEIESNEGQGSKFTLVIPLSVAFLNTMVVQVQGRNYAISIDNIAEVVQASQAIVVFNSASGGSSLRIRQELVPVRPLSDLFEEQASTQDPEVYVVIHSLDRQIAIPVDAILGQYQVSIKPLTGCLEEIRGISGCAILPNGDISWVLDSMQLVEIDRQASPALSEVIAS